MLTRLSISNYALISKLDIDFHAGLNTITGETGAGKSIILGALGLILGKRADLSVLKDQNRKCIVEGIFEVKNYNLEVFFTENDLDYDNPVILRREITSSGKSRSFINDTPVQLKVLRVLGLMLIDIHSQHQNLELGNHKFQLQLVDEVSGAKNILQQYRQEYKEYKSLEKALHDLKELNDKEKTDLDYWQFQFNQLEGANLQENEQEILEAELSSLTHAEEILNALTGVHELLNNDQYSVVQNLKSCQKLLESIDDYVKELPDLTNRLQSCYLEVKDILEESERLSSNIEFDQNRIELVSERLNVIYNLQQKYKVTTIKELIDVMNSLTVKIDQVAGFDERITQTEDKLLESKEKLKELADALTAVRVKSFTEIEKAVVGDLKQLGMEKSSLQVVHEPLTDFTPEGKDAVSVLFSANADSMPAEISKIASGGEMSRLMLAVKNLLRTSKALPTVVFDEIDAGISGETALQMGYMLKDFSSSTQIINITHLPQIAARGNTHFKVFKFEEKGKTYTSVKLLKEEERIEELAKMVGGENLTTTTLKTARELLNGL